MTHNSDNDSKNTPGATPYVPVSEYSEAYIAGVNAAGAFVIETREGDSATNVPAVMIPDGMSLETFENLLDQPINRKDTIIADDIDGFVDYVERFGSVATTQLFFDLNDLVFLAVLDYNTPDMFGDAWCRKTCRMTLTPGEEWATWEKRNLDTFSQRDFASFLEENTDDIVNPNGAELIETINKFRATKNTTFRQDYDETSGDVHLVHTTETRAQDARLAGLDTVFPKEITIGIPPYQGANPYRITARLLYRVSDSGVLSLSYKLPRTRRSWLDAGKKAGDELRGRLDGFSIINGWRK